MIVLLDTSEALDVCAMELGCEVHQLVTPAPGFNRQKEHDWYGFDNGAFGGFKEHLFRRILNREGTDKHLCKFLAVPDVVGSAVRTLELFQYWRYKLTGWPLALVAQDGLEQERIPSNVWDSIAAVFIGGTTSWKLGQHAVETIRCAQGMGKWVHVGRVNTPGRFEYFDRLGADSIDGTGLSRYTHMREEIWRAYNQPNLLTDLAPNVGESFPLPMPSRLTAEIAIETTAAIGIGESG
jgi:hypothetical protein